MKKLPLLALTAVIMAGCNDFKQTEKDVKYTVILNNNDTLQISACYWYYKSGTVRFKRQDGAITKLRDVKHIIAK